MGQRQPGGFLVHPMLWHSQELGSPYFASEYMALVDVMSDESKSVGRQASLIEFTQRKVDLSTLIVSDRSGRLFWKRCEFVMVLRRVQE